MAITVLKNNVPWGPFTRDQIKDGLARGDFTLQYLAHTPGLKEWLPLGEVLHYIERDAVLPPVPDTRNVPPIPKAPVPPTPLAKPVSPPLPVIRSAPEPVLPTAEPEVTLPKASFIARVFALGIDCAILFVPIFILCGLGAILLEIKGWWQHLDAESMRQEWLLLRRNFQQLLLLVALGLGWLYAAGMESSRGQGTIGKRWMGIKVTDSRGERLGFLQASGRHAAKFLSALPFFLGFVMALFSRRGRALHDRLAGTRVVKDI